MKNTSIWIVGSKAKIGRALVTLLKRNPEYRLLTTDREVDVTDLAAVTMMADRNRPEIIINCSAVAPADYCEEHEVEAYAVNALGARNLAIVSRKHNAKLIHISTDDVFCGVSQRAKNEFDVPTPDTVYGKSKYAGEQFIKNLNPKHLIIRSSWIYGEGGHKDYVAKVLEKGKAGEHFKASIQNISSPTSANAIAKFIIKLLHTEEYGIYHAAAEGITTRHHFAATILKMAGYDPSLAQPEYSHEGVVITSTLLRNLMMELTGIHKMDEWEKELETYIKGLE
ncbi:MAG: NAD(P)-dependent oxidoreductase [Dorea sp.]|nr:NAD(P)-dependent oxidoreductase [Dorea sp.]